MADEPTPIGEQEAAQAGLPESYILITFAGPGSAEIGMEIKASPVQIFGAIGVLQAQAEQLMRGAAQNARPSPLVVPSGMLRDHLPGKSQ